MSLEKGIAAVEQGNYLEAIGSLEAFCQNCPDSLSRDYSQAKMWLALAYHGVGEVEQVVPLCKELSKNPNPEVSDWAQQWLKAITAYKYSTKYLAQLKESGHEGLKQKNYPEAIKLLEEFCKNTPDQKSLEYQQAKMWLVQAYRGNRQIDGAIYLCDELEKSDDTMIRQWAKQTSPNLKENFQKTFKKPDASTAREDTIIELKSDKNQENQASPTENTHIKDHDNLASPTENTHIEDHESFSSYTVESPSDQVSSPKNQPTRLRFAVRGIANNLALASGVTISLLLGMVLALCLGLTFILHSPNPQLGLIISIGLTVIFNLAMFFISPLVMDFVQRILYKTEWIDLEELREQSPESAATLERVCAEKNLKIPRLGLINDNNPTAFTYGSFPNSARLVVSQGLFKYLDNQEAATVYAHELGHIVHWDFAVMTLGSALVQITYLIYVYARRFQLSLGNEQLKKGMETASVAAYIFYVLGNYLLLYLSRTREYYADHFAAEVTGDPNALSRGLIKIAYGIVEEGQKSEKPSNLTEGTRALGIYDPKGAPNCGTAYRVGGDPHTVGRVFLWDLFNPWGWWMELNSTHPLTGKRIRALTNYAEQMDLEAEFDMAAVIKEGNGLDKRKLYQGFILDLILFNAPLIGLLLGIGAAFSFNSVGGALKEFVALPLMGFGAGMLVKTAVMYPDYKRARETDILTLMSDPYASPLRGRPVRLKGELIGRGDAGNQVGSDLQLQDTTGMMFTRYASMFGPIGNFLFGLTRVQSLLGTKVIVLAWFRRGVAPWLDLIGLDNQEEIINSYPRLGSLILGLGAIILGLILGFFLPRNF